MALDSDLSIDVSKFRPEAASDGIMKFNELLMDRMKSEPKWFRVNLSPCAYGLLSLIRQLQIGAAKYREMKSKGETAIPAAALLDRGEPFSIPSREQGRDIPCRVMRPQTPRAVFMHIHGGGFVFSSETA